MYNTKSTWYGGYMVEQQTTQLNMEFYCEFGKIDLGQEITFNAN